MYEQYPVDKKVVLVGGSSGIGRAVAQEAAAAGAHIVLASRNQQRLEEARQEILGHVEAFTMDMLDEASVATFFEQVGSLDHLVISAVADETKLGAPITQLSTANAQRGMEKFWGTFFVARAAASRMNAGGSMTFVSSVSIFNPPCPNLVGGYGGGYQLGVLGLKGITQAATYVVY